MKRRNPYLLVGVAVALIVYLVLTRPIEGLEETVKIADEGQTVRIPEGTIKVKYGADSRWAYKDVTAQDKLITCSNQIFGDPAPGTGKACYAIFNKPDTSPGSGTGGTPCKASQLNDTRVWANKGGKDLNERFKYSKAMGDVLTAEECGKKCCSENKCNAFTYSKTRKTCWIYHDELETLELASEKEAINAEYTCGTVDRSGGLSDLTNKLSGGLNASIGSVYGFLGSGLSVVGIVVVILVVLAAGIPLAVYVYKSYLGGKALPASSVPIGNPVTRMTFPGAK